MNRLKRQTMIKRLVTENEIHTQSELLALLEKENIHTTQATISRDIRELNLNKVDNGQGEAYYRILPFVQNIKQMKNVLLTLLLKLVFL